MHNSEPTDRQQGARSPTPAERMSMYYAALRRHWRLAACIVGVAVLVGLLVGALSPKSHDATAKVLIGQRTQVDSLLGAADYTPDPERDVNTSVELITLEPVAERVRRTLRLDLPASALVGKVSTAVDHNSNVVSITVRDASPERAARIANAFAVAYRDFRARSARASIEDAIASAETRATGLAPGPELDALEGKLRGLTAAAAFQTGGVQIVRRATAASAEASGSALKSAVVAGLLGVILAVVAIVVLARTDKRVRGEDDLEALLGAPVLATLPTPRSSNPAGVRDALATLGLSLVLRLRSREAKAGRRNGRLQRVLLVTSPGAGEGTSEVALGLARALGDMGRRVIAIEADLREPTFARRLGLNPTAGLTDVVVGTRNLGEELVELAPTSARVFVLPAGAPFVLPQPLLAGEDMASLVASARRRAEFVLIAGAPAGSFGDSLALAPLADTVLVVARRDVTDREQALGMVEAFRQLDRPPLGVVITTDAFFRGTASLAAETDVAPPPAEPEPGPPEREESATVTRKRSPRGKAEVLTP
jgi:polysaccharide biosynthesis transport protein